MRRVLVLCGVLAARPAHAAGVADLAPSAGDRGAARVGFTLTASPRTTAVETHAAIPRVAAVFRPAPRTAPRLALSVDLAASFTSYRFRDQSRGEVARVANPVLAFSFDAGLFSLGAAAGAPLLTVPGGITANAAAEHADRTAMGATGARDAWLWARNAVPLLLFFRASLPLWERVEARVSVEPGLLVSVNRNPSAAALLASVECGVRTGTELTPGLRLTTFTSSRPLDTHDFMQTSAAAFLRWGRRGRFFGDAEVTVGLDGPGGITRRTATGWGAAAATGVRF